LGDARAHASGDRASGLFGSRVRELPAPQRGAPNDCEQVLFLRLFGHVGSDCTGFWRLAQRSWKGAKRHGTASSPSARDVRVWNDQELFTAGIFGLRVGRITRETLRLHLAARHRLPMSDDSREGGPSGGLAGDEQAKREREPGCSVVLLLVRPLPCRVARVGDGGHVAAELTRASGQDGAGTRLPPASNGSRVRLYPCASALRWSRCRR